MIAIAGTLVVVGGVFSFASGIFHPYYVSMVAPWAAALIGAGVGMAFSGPLLAADRPGAADRRDGHRAGRAQQSDTGGDLSWAKPVAIAGTAACGLLLFFVTEPAGAPGRC